MRLISSKEIAVAIGSPKRSVLRRAAAEKWRHELICGNGGKTKYFYVDSLPADVQAHIDMGDTPSEQFKIVRAELLRLIVNVTQLLSDEILKIKELMGL